MAAKTRESDRLRAAFCSGVGLIAWGGGFFLDRWAPREPDGLLGTHWAAAGLGLSIAAVLAAFISRPPSGRWLAAGAWPLAGGLGLLMGLLAVVQPELRAALLPAGLFASGGLAIAIAVLRWSLALVPRVLPPPLLDPKHKHPSIKGGEGKASKRAAHQLAPGDVVELDVRERIPIDGTIVRGDGFTDDSALTGSTVPQVKELGDSVLAGAVSQIPDLQVRAETAFDATLLSRRDRHLVELVRRLEQDRRAPLVVAIAMTALAVIGASIVIALRFSLGLSVWLAPATGLLLAAAAGAPLFALRLGKARLLAFAAERGLIPADPQDAVELSRVRRWQIDPRLLATPGELEAIAFGDVPPPMLIGLAHALLEETEGPERTAIAAELERKSISPPRPAALKRENGIWYGTVAGERWLMGPPALLEKHEKLVVEKSMQGPLQFIQDKALITWVLARPKEIAGAIGVRLEIEAAARDTAQTLKAALVPGLPDGTRQALAEAAGLRRDGPPLKSRDATLAAPDSAPPSAGLVLRVVEPRPRLALGRDQGTLLLAPALGELPLAITGLKRRWRSALLFATLSAVVPLAGAAGLAAADLIGPASGTLLAALGFVLARRAGR